MTSPADQRIDPYLGTVVHVVGARQARPNLPSTGCPFCVGGLEAPDPYEVHWFPNRWPAMQGDRCEVVLYTPHHDATLPSLGVPASARSSTCGPNEPPRSASATTSTSCWCSRIAGHRSAQPSPIRTARSTPTTTFRNDPPRCWPRVGSPRSTAAIDSSRARNRQRRRRGAWTACVPEASTFPIALTLAPTRQVPDLPSLDDDGRDALAALLVDILDRLDRLYDQPLPYMMWLNQRPTDGQDVAAVVVQHRDRVAVAQCRCRRFIAAAEVAGGEYFNPVIPEDLARAASCSGSCTSSGSSLAARSSGSTPSVRHRDVC